MILVGILFFIFTRNNIEEASGFIVAKMQECHENQEEGRCYSKAAEAFIERYEIPEILAVFKKNEKEPEFFTKCHLTAHYLGRLAYKKFGSAQKVFSQSDYTCLGGVIHGAMEGYFIEKDIPLTPENEPLIADEVADLCGKYDDYPVPQKHTECLHGLGHALMFYAQNEVPKALELCDVLGISDREICYSGVFMENWTNVGNVDHPTKYARLNDPLFPCPVLARQYQRICYTYGVLVLPQSSIQKSIEACFKVPDEYQNDCFQTLGRDRTIISASPKEIKDQCDQIINPNFIRECYKGAAYNLVIRFGTQSDLAFQFCDLIKDKSDCYAQIGRGLRKMARDQNEILAACSRTNNKEYEKICVEFSSGRLE